MNYSLIIPVYNRPDEVAELLESLQAQEYRDFELIVVEDGSSIPCGEVVARFGVAGSSDGLSGEALDHGTCPGAGTMDIKYFSKPNGGPGQARNYGAARASGEYLVFLDSDVTVPAGWFEAMDAELSESPADAWGGPDRADESFTDIQKAISYSMTSFFTTGGIRGGKKKLDKFYPRSFNMGIRRDVFEALGGYSSMRFGEDIDLSIRIFKGGYRCRLFPKAWVCHKRRTDFRKFFKQVHNSGIARINLYKKYPESLKVVHLLPAAFTIGTAFLLLAGFFVHGAWFLLFLYALLLFCDSAWDYESWRIGLLSVVAAFVQLIGYGTGFLRAWWARCVKGRGEMEAFRTNFYK